MPEYFRGVAGFEWDEANSDKSWRRHGVTQAESEQVFFNRPLLVSLDAKHSVRETRHIALGRTDAGRGLAVVFAIRGAFLRVISARTMSRKERGVYAQIRTD